MHSSAAAGDGACYGVLGNTHSFGCRVKVMFRVLILGASGTGTTTLGRAVGNDLSFRVFDTDDYYWLPSTPPFQRKQDPEVRLATLIQDLKVTSRAIISGSILNWGARLEDSLSLIVFLTVPTAVRIARLEMREMRLYGRVDPEFLAWAAQYDEGKMSGRSREKHEQWLSQRACPVLRIEGDTSTVDRVRRVRAAIAEYCPI
jgi:adenylate kinase family enzyme